MPEIPYETFHFRGYCFPQLSAKSLDALLIRLIIRTLTLMLERRIDLRTKIFSEAIELVTDFSFLYCYQSFGTRYYRLSFTFNFARSESTLRSLKCAKNRSYFDRFVDFRRIAGIFQNHKKHERL